LDKKNGGRSGKEIPTGKHRGVHIRFHRVLKGGGQVGKTELVASKKSGWLGGEGSRNTDARRQSKNKKGQLEKKIQKGVDSYQGKKKGGAETGPQTATKVTDEGRDRSSGRQRFKRNKNRKGGGRQRMKDKKKNIFERGCQSPTRSKGPYQLKKRSRKEEREGCKTNIEFWRELPPAHNKNNAHPPCGKRTTHPGGEG